MWTMAFAAAGIVAAAAAPAEICFPACRTGFTCHLGACVSLCNPPCPSGEKCTAGGECVSEADWHPASEPEPLPAAPVDDAKERRKATAWSVYPGLGIAVVEAAAFLPEQVDPDDKDALRVKPVAAAVSVGFGLRRHFTRLLGYQARLSLLGGMEPGNDGGSMAGLAADASLRIGPVANAFPWYFGIGPMLGYYRVSQPFAEFPNTYEKFQNLATDHPSGQMKPGSRFDFAIYAPLAAGMAETGFLFGEDSTLDVCVRGFFGTTGKDVSAGAQLVVGYRLGGDGR